MSELIKKNKENNSESTEIQMKKLASRIFVYSILLNESLDDAEKFGLFRHMLKKRSKQLNKELQSSIEVIFKNGVNPNDLLKYSAVVSKEVEEILESTLSELGLN